MRASHLLARTVGCVALTVTLPALAFLGHESVCTLLPTINNETAYNGLLAVLCVVCAILIWRRLVLWTLGRRVLTCVVSAIPFAQVVWARPLWESGCGGNTVLMLAQEQISVGLWIWLTIWVWWGIERLAQARGSEGESRMTTSGKRVVASLASVPFVFGAFWLMVQAVDDFTELQDEAIAVVVGFATAILAIAAWILIWRRQVAWTRAVRVRTIALAGTLVFLTIAPMPYLAEFSGFFDDTYGALPLIGWGAWMAGTMLIWPMKASTWRSASRAPRCPGCGYALAGLTRTRCPECGAEPTLDELWSFCREGGL